MSASEAASVSFLAKPDAGKRRRRGPVVTEASGLGVERLPTSKGMTTFGASMELRGDNGRPSDLRTGRGCYGAERENFPPEGARPDRRTRLFSNGGRGSSRGDERRAWHSRRRTAGAAQCAQSRWCGAASAHSTGRDAADARSAGVGKATMVVVGMGTGGSNVRCSSHREGGAPRTRVYKWYQSTGRSRKVQMARKNGESSSGGEFSVSLPTLKLTRTNYRIWSMSMEVYLDSHDLWQAVVGENVTKKKDRMALSAIMSVVSEEQLLLLDAKKSARENWEILRQRNLGVDRVIQSRIQALKREYELLNMTRIDSVEDFSMKFTRIVSNLRNLGEAMIEKEVVRRFLRAMPAKFDALTLSLEQYGDLDKISLDEVIGSLTVHEMRLKDRESREEEQALLAKAMNKTRIGNEEDFSTGGRGRGHGRSRGRGRFSTVDGRDRKFFDKSKIQCYNCQRYGHFSYECRNEKRERGDSAYLTESSQAAPVTAEEEEETSALLMAFEEIDSEFLLQGAEGEHPKSDLWYLDTGATNHMTGNRNFFSQLDESSEGFVKFGDNSRVKIEGRGSISIIKKDGEAMILENVVFVPQLCANILSLGRLDEEGYKKSDALHHFKKFKNLAEGEKGVKIKSPYSPQQNGIVERRNRTIMGLVRREEESPQDYAEHEEDQGSAGTSSDQRSSSKVPENQRYKSVSQLYEDTTPQIQDEHECLVCSEEPRSYPEASQEEAWRAAMEEEMKAIIKNCTWSLVELPEGCRPIGLKWIYKIKKDDVGNVLRHKARLVVKGYSQKQGIDYGEVFAPVDWTLHHLDVKSAFLNGDVEEDLYVKQPEGFVVQGKEGHVLKLHKALYGLKQAPRAWYFKLHNCLLSLGFTRSKHEQGICCKISAETHLVIGVYVDDLLLTGNEEKDIQEFKRQMKSHFDMSDLGKLSCYLGIRVSQEANSITLSQKTYSQNILKHAGMMDCNAVHTPTEARMKFNNSSRSSVDPSIF
ncbi:uncharacterized protein LOC144708789 [Wolffia australiana]